MPLIRTVITGTGSYIPPHIKTNQDFVNQAFYGEDQQPLTTPATEIVEKFKDITGIEERRYAGHEFNSSDMALIAAKHAIDDAGTLKALTRLSLPTILEILLPAAFSLMPCQHWLPG